MKPKSLIAIAAALLVVSLIPAVAGGEECAASQTAQAAEKKSMKCTEPTQLCLDHMASHFKNRGWVGIEMDSDEVTGALTITHVEPESPAKRADLRKGDVLVALNGIQFSDENKSSMESAHQKMTVGATINYTVRRGTREQDVPVTLEAIPETVMAKWIGRHMLEHASVEVAKK